MDGDRVWANAHKFAIFLMRLLKDQVSAFGFDPVNPLEVRELCKEWPGNMTETPPCPPKLQDHKQYHGSGSEQQGTTICQVQAGRHNDGHGRLLASIQACKRKGCLRTWTDAVA